MSLRVSTLSEEIPLQASKWLSCQVLADQQEMENLLAALGEFYIYSVGAVIESGSGEISRSEFITAYKEYIELLQQGKLPDEARYRKQFSTVFTIDKNALFALQVDGGKHLVRISKPVIQVQAHRMDYSQADGKFRSMTFGGDSISWGLQFSYPQIYQDGKTKEIHQVDTSANCPNTSLFRALQLWVRNNTVPTPFMIDGKKMHIPVRLGKNCFAWINEHPQLRSKSLQVCA